MSIDQRTVSAFYNGAAGTDVVGLEGHFESTATREPLIDGARLRGNAWRANKAESEASAMRVEGGGSWEAEEMVAPFRDPFVGQCLVLAEILKTMGDHLALLMLMPNDVPGVYEAVQAVRESQAAVRAMMHALGCDTRLF